MTSRPKHPIPTRLRLWKIFLGFSLIFLSVIPVGYMEIDGSSMFAVALSLGKHLSFAVPCDVGVPGTSGHCYSEWYPLLSVLAAPFVLLGRERGAAAGVAADDAAVPFAFIVPALATAGAATLTVALALEHRATPRRAVWAGLAFAFGTAALTYARTFYAEPLTAFFVALAAWGLVGTAARRRAGYAAVALLVLTKPQLAPVGPALGLGLTLVARDPRPLIRVSLATAVGVLLYLAYNYVRFGNALDFGGQTRELRAAAYTPGRLLDAAGLLLISPARGLLWFSPVAVIGLVMLVRRARQPMAAASLLAAAVTLAIYLGNPGVGGMWGPRYFVAILPLLCAPLGALNVTWSKVAVVLATLTLLSQVPNVVGTYDRYYAEKLDQGVASSALYWDVSATPLIGVWSSAAHQIRDASHVDVRTVVSGGRQSHGATVSDKQLLQVVALWWWLLPAVGIPWWCGALIAIAVLGVGCRVLATETPRATGDPELRARRRQEPVTDDELTARAP